MQHDDAYFKSAVNAAATRAYQMATRFGLSRADREDLHQELMLDLLERAGQFEPQRRFDVALTIVRLRFVQPRP